MSRDDLGAEYQSPPGEVQLATRGVGVGRAPVRPGRVLLLVALLVLGGLGAGARSTSSWLRVEPGPAPNLAPLLQGSVADPGVREREYLITTVRVEELSWGRYWLERLTEQEHQYIPAEGGGGVDPAAVALQMRESKRVALALASARADQSGPPRASGVIASKVGEGSAAAEAGIQPGDRIVSYVSGGEERPTGESAAFVEAVSALPEGSELVLVLEDGTRRSAVLRGAPGSSGRLGVEVVTEIAPAALPAGIEIATEGIGGPSGGLMFSLLYLDALEPGDLSGGRVVAGTGTISLDGQVGQISGIGDKVRGAKAAGAQVFFAPAGEAALAREASKGTLEVVGVETLDEAVRWLCEHGGKAPSCERG